MTDGLFNERCSFQIAALNNNLGIRLGVWPGRNPIDLGKSLVSQVLGYLAGGSWIAGGILDCNPKGLEGAIALTF